LLREIPPSQYQGNTNQLLLNRFGKSVLRDESYFEYTDRVVQVADLRMTINGFQLVDENIDPMSYTSSEFIVPIYSIGRDQYLTGRYDSEISLVVNEGSMGMYLANVDRMKQIPRTTLHEIHSFMNTANQAVFASDLSTVVTAMNAKRESGEAYTWKPGDDGLYEVSRGKWIACKVVSAELRTENSNEWVLRIEFSEQGITRQRTLLSTSERLLRP
jgi:hypothetical protein